MTQQLFHSIDFQRMSQPTFESDMSEAIAFTWPNTTSFGSPGVLLADVESHVRAALASVNLAKGTCSIPGLEQLSNQLHSVAHSARLCRSMATLQATTGVVASILVEPFDASDHPATNIFASITDSGICNVITRTAIAGITGTIARATALAASEANDAAMMWEVLTRHSATQTNDDAESLSPARAPLQQIKVRVVELPARKPRDVDFGE